MLGAELGRKVEFVELPWADQFEALGSGKTDIIMSSMSITPVRRQVHALRDIHVSIRRGEFTAIVGTVEFDHADIYRDEAEVKRVFRWLTNIVPRRGLIVRHS